MSQDKRSLYEIVYSKYKGLKDDDRLTYYSFNSILRYEEVYYLGLFTILYTAGASLSIRVANP